MLQTLATLLAYTLAACTVPIVIGMFVLIYSFFMGEPADRPASDEKEEDK
jgi:hypothetical protein